MRLIKSAFFASLSLWAGALLFGQVLLEQIAVAQTEIRNGVLPLNRFSNWESQSDATLSAGVLADLESDPNFSGDFQFVYDQAANILNNYTVVARGGYFPENAGIPREQQLSYAQAVYYFYLLPNRNGLILYRSPAENTARYIIRKSGAGFLLP